MTDNALRIRWDGGEHTAQTADTVTIGRDPANTIVLEASAVSRRHGQIRFDGQTWAYQDLDSTQGSYVAGTRVTDVPLIGIVALRLGRGDNAVTLDIEAPSARPATAAPADPTRAVASRDEDAMAAAAGAGVAAAAGAARPGGALADGVEHAATIVPAGNDERAITVSAGDTSRTVGPAETVTIGRESDNDVVVNDPAVSRHHARVVHDGNRWLLTDLGSAAGTWLAGTRITNAVLEGEQEFHLGDKNGTALLRTSAPEGWPAPAPETRADDDAVAATAAATADGTAAPRKSRVGLIAVIAAAAVLLAAVGGGLVWWGTHRGADNQQLASATVWIRADTWTGSGTIIDAEKGLILTNAHVASPDALGTAVNHGSFKDRDSLRKENPATYQIDVTTGLDKSAEPRFIAEPVAADGYLDLAVLKITKTLNGAQITSEDLAGLQEAPLGNSDTVRSGDDVTVFGYPSASDSTAVTLTQGVVSTVQGDDRVGVNNAMIVIDATVAHGNSGGLAADSRGKMIGIPTLVLPDPGTETKQNVLSAIRPINLAKPLIDAAESGSTYTSPYTQPAPAGAEITGLDEQDVTAGNPASVTSGCTPGQSQSGGGVAFSLDYKGFPGGKNTDVLVELRDSSGKPVAIAVTKYPTSLPTEGCMTVTLATAYDGDTLPDGSYRLLVGLGGDYTPIYDDNVTWGSPQPKPSPDPTPAPSDTNAPPGG